MPTNKDFKRVVRERMKKTGESYTAARAQLLRNTPPSPDGRAASSGTRAAMASAPASDYATLAGMSDASVKKATGCTWERWVTALDKARADRWTHKEIAQYVRNTYNTTDWWTQMVTVGYERIKGLRVRGQQRDGTYDVSKSKVVHAPVAVLFEAFADAKQRRRWLPDVEPEVRRATRNKSVRMRWPDGSAVDVGFFSKGNAKSQVAIGHTKLASQDDAQRMKAFWSEKLQTLADHASSQLQRND
jgi:hypothetical protein